MSGSRKFCDGRRFEKSSFAQTCNLLSRYIKEKGSLRDLNLEIGGKVESLEAIVKPGSAHCASASTTMNILTDKGKAVLQFKEEQTSMVMDSSFNTAGNASYKPPSKEATATDSKVAQLTIFYSGRVLVFDEYPADKARELVSFAKKQSSQVSYGISSNTFTEKPSPSRAVGFTSSPIEGLPPRPLATTSSQKAVSISLNTCKEKVSTEDGGAGQVNAQPEANGSDLPIARRSSLHRFLEKRKDRAAGRGPYHQVQEQPASSSSKGDEQLELRL